MSSHGHDRAASKVAVRIVHSKGLAFLSGGIVISQATAAIMPFFASADVG
jgi:hypothetical protein